MRNKWLLNIIKRLKIITQNLRERILRIYYLILNRKKLKKYYKNQSREKKGVIYTCITGNYDFLKMYKYFDENWDYICFTDNEDLIKKERLFFWEIKKIKYKNEDKIKLSRWHKINVHKLFNNYEKSIWIDASIVIMKKEFFDLIGENETKFFVSNIHSKRKCIYQEIKACIFYKKENLEKAKKILKKLKKEKYPINNGLYETGIIYRRHNEMENKIIAKEWWEFIENYSSRDQLSLNFIFWKNNFETNYFTKKSFYYERNSMIKIVNHSK